MHERMLGMQTRSQYKVENRGRFDLDRAVACSCVVGFVCVVGPRRGLDLLLAEGGTFAHSGWCGTEQSAEAPNKRNGSPDRFPTSWIAQQPVPTLAEMTTRPTARLACLPIGEWAGAVIRAAAWGADEPSTQ